MLVEIFLFAVYFSLFSWLTHKPGQTAEREVIKIGTTTPKGQLEKEPILAVEIDLDSNIENQITNDQYNGHELTVAASQSAITANGTKTRNEEYQVNSSTRLSVAAQNINSALVAAEGRVAVALRNDALKNGSHGEVAKKLPKIEEVVTVVTEQSKYDQKIISQAVQESRREVGKKIKEFVETKSQISGSYEPLYDLLTDYPFRAGKMLRPTMCISVARAVGGMGQDALTSAAALELYHNAFLIHDDIEDGSASRRGKGTLHQMIGIPRAINVGDATNVLAVGLLLENLSVIGVSKALNVLHEIEFMAQQSVEGQAMELDWVANNASNLTDQDYFKMCVKKTCWYTFITPCRIGAIVGYPSASDRELVEYLAGLTRFGMILGIAFQIQDDLLNLQGELETYGKEIGGDIYEGKRTLMLNHLLANSGDESKKVLEIMALPREEKTQEQLTFILDRMQGRGSIEHGWKVARSLARKAAEIFESLDFLQPETPLRPQEEWGCPVHDRRFLKELINYVIYRNA